MSDEPGSDPERPPGRAAQRRPSGQLAAGIVLGGLLVAFALLNLDRVDVNWLLGTWSTPLILVIAASVLVGAVLDRAVVMARRRKRS